MSMELRRRFGLLRRLLRLLRRWLEDEGYAGFGFVRLESWQYQKTCVLKYYCEYFVVEV